MLTSARERLEILKIRRQQGLLNKSSLNNSNINNGASTAASMQDQNTAASKTPRENVPHTTVELYEGEKQIDYWKDVALARDRDMQLREQCERAASQKFRDEQRRVVDEHVRMKQKQAEVFQQDERAERVTADKMFDEFIATNREKKQKQRSIAQNIGTMREEQLALKQRRIDAELQERREFDLRAVARSQEALRQEQQLMRIKKEEARVRAAETAAENARMKRMKEQRQIDIDEEDARALAKMNAILEAQEATRKQDFEKLKDKMKARETIAHQRQATVAEKARLDQERAARLTLERDQAAVRIQEERDKVAKERVRVVKAENLVQAEERRRELDKFKLLKEREREEVLIETQSIQRAREQERTARAAKHQDCDVALQKQMTEHRRKQMIVMSDIERRMNTALLPKEVQVPEARLAKLKLPLIR
jgi:hypothetical protein